MDKALYQRERWKQRPPAKCHPDRKDHAGGLCRSCYRNKNNRAPRAKCHPDRLEASRGLCSSCYNKEPDIAAKRNAARNLKKYNLTEDEYFHLLEECDSKCSICGREDDLVIDHCHETNEVRGILCRMCNTGLGHFKDDEKLLNGAIEYLCKKTG